MIPHIIPAPAAVAADRQAFGLPPNPFIVMAFGSIKSGTARKNLDGAVQAFQQAFPQRNDVCLVLKVSDQGWAPERASQLGARIGQDPRILLYGETLSDDAIWSLMACADAIISCTGPRASGWCWRRR